MRILIITEYFPPVVFGGGELSAYYLAKALVAYGHEVHVFTSSVVGEPDDVVMDGVRVVRRLRTGSSPYSLSGNVWRVLLFPWGLKRLARLLGGMGFDVVHCMNMSSLMLGKWYPGITAHVNSPLPWCPKGDCMRMVRECCGSWRPGFFGFVRCLLRSSYVGKLDNHWYIRFNPLFWLLAWYRSCAMFDGLRNARKVVAISEYIKGLSGRGDAVVIPNIIPLERFFRVSSFPRSGDGFLRVVFVGSLLGSKGLHVLDSALAVCPVPIICDAYGGGPLDGLLKNVRIKSAVSQESLPQVLSGYDVLVLPAVWPEPFGRAVVEAMAAGLPVVISDAGGLPELVEHGISGLVVRSGDVGALSAAFVCLSDAELRGRMALAARRRAKALVDERDIVLRFIKAVSS